MKSETKVFTVLSVLTLIFFASNISAMEEVSEQKSDHHKTKVMSYNICTTYNLYGDEKLDPKERLPKIEKQFETFAPDVICLQEARKKEAKAFSVMLHKLGYDVILSPVNGGAEGKTLITAYNAKKYFCQKTKRWWYTEDDPKRFGTNKWCKWGGILTLATLYKLKGEHPDYTKPLHIANTHLGLKEDEKEMSIRLALSWLKGYLQKKEREKDPIVWCGDFNFFDDMRGAKQRKMITEAGFDDNLENLTDLEGNKLNGTFVGYSTDRFKPESLSTLTRLDGIFSQNVKMSPAKCPTAGLKEDLSNRDDLASDHLPVISEIL